MTKLCSFAMMGTCSKEVDDHDVDLTEAGRQMFLSVIDVSSTHAATSPGAETKGGQGGLEPPHFFK